MGSDVRIVVTNLPGAAKALYEKVYCARGRMENMIKDMKLYTRSDRTPCYCWEANQFRLDPDMAAYWLLHALKRRCAQALAMAHGDFRDAAARLSQNRGARGRTEKPYQGRLPLSLSARAGARSPRRINDRSKPMTVAASAAQAPIPNPQRVAMSTHQPTVKPADDACLLCP